MVPRLRLVLAAAVVVVPLLGLAMSLPAWRVDAALGIGLLAGVAAADAWRGARALRDVRLVPPAALQLVQGRAAPFLLGIETGPRPRAFHLRVGFALPSGLRLAPGTLEVLVPAAAGRHEVECTVSAPRRGLYEIGGCHYEAASPFGLWDVRGRAAAGSVVRVFPNIDRERRQLASLFLRLRHSGATLARQVGQGRDFEKLREYVPGDPYNTIHWKASARRRHPITKVFQIEKMQEVYVVVDASRLSARLEAPGRVEKGTHLDRYISAALALGLAAEQQGDLFGLVTFSDRVLNFVRARNGKEHYGACREAFYRLQPQPVSPDFDELAIFLRLRLRRRALLVFLTGLDDPVLMETFRHSLDLVARQHLVLVCMLQSDNIRELFTRPEVAGADEIYQDLAHHFAWNDLRQFGAGLRRQGVGFSLFPPDRFGAEVIAGYLRVKRNQLL